MKKSLAILIALSALLGLAGASFAGPPCGPVQNCFWTPPCVVPPVAKPPKHIVVKEYITKKIAAERVLCRGKAGGAVRDCGPCGPCGPAIRWKCDWFCAAQGPEVEAKYLVTKRATLVKPEKPKVELGCCFGNYF